MKVFNRLRLLNTFRIHETLTIDDVAKEENLGMEVNPLHLSYLLGEMTESGYLQVLNDIKPVTYTITTKGIKECERLRIDGN